MSYEGEPSARARRITFRTGYIFPHDNQLSVPLLRLMMATDDARHLQKRLIAAGEDLDNANDAEAATLNGEMAHLFRMLCGYLYEAGHPFRAIDGAPAKVLELAVADDEKGKTGLVHVRRAYATGSGEVFHYSFLKPVRDHIGFHYKPEALNQALGAFVEMPDVEGSLTICEHAGLSRYNITDHLTAVIISSLLKVKLEDLRERLKERMVEAIDLAGHLAYVVDRLLLYLFKTHPGCVLENRESAITVPPQLRQARQKVERERKDKGNGERRQP